MAWGFITALAGVYGVLRGERDRKQAKRATAHRNQLLQQELAQEKRDAENARRPLIHQLALAAKGGGLPNTLNEENRRRQQRTSKIGGG